MSVRNGKEFRRIQRSIEKNNPATAGLAAKAEDYVWSSAGRPERPPQAEGLPHNYPWPVHWSSLSLPSVRQRLGASGHGRATGE